MRKIVIGLLAAATALTPIAANAAPDDGGNRSRFQARAERAERSDGGQRAERAPRGERGAARGQQRQAVQQRQAPQAVQSQRAEQRQVQQRQAQSGRQWQGRGRDNGDRAALEQRIQETREASRRSAEGLSPRYQRQAAENQRRTEERLREQYRDNRRDDRGDWRSNRNDNRNDWRNGRDNDRRWSDNRRDGRDWNRDGRNWNRGWRNDNRYDWQRYRYSNRNIYRLRPYYAPYRGYSYVSFSIGGVLDPLFFGSRYWVNDPFYYRLPPAPLGARWVRYYDDVLLVDTYTGEVIDVIHNFFW